MKTPEERFWEAAQWADELAEKFFALVSKDAFCKKIHEAQSDARREALHEAFEVAVWNRSHVDAAKKRGRRAISQTDGPAIASSIVEDLRSLLPAAETGKEPMNIKRCGCGWEGRSWDIHVCPCMEPEPAPKPLTESRVREIVREEIQSACLVPERHNPLVRKEYVESMIASAIARLKIQSDVTRIEPIDVT